MYRGCLLLRCQRFAGALDGGVTGGGVGEGRALRHRLAIQPQAKGIALGPQVSSLASQQALAHRTGGLAVGEGAGQQ